jgi:hypothetical protein
MDCFPYFEGDYLSVHYVHPPKNAIYRYCSIGNMKKSTMFEAVFRNTNVIFGETWENHGKTPRKPSHQKRRIAVQQAKPMSQTQNDAIYAADTINVIRAPHCSDLEMKLR